MTSTKNRFIFTLDGLNINNIESKYELTNDVSETNEDVLTNTTKISDLVQQNPSSITFLGAAKQIHKCSVSMIDFSSNSDVSMLKYHCFWCKNPFGNMQIGCPISHKPRKITKKYVSVITQTEYIIEEPIASTDIEYESYYQTDGVFCSFNCCSAYIDDNKNNPLYNNSSMLLLNLYNEMFERKIIHIPIAPHWRTISQYGGYMSINEFRESFDKVEYQNHGYLMDISKKMVSSSLLYEAKLKF
jgi:hypothetical protein